jgi:heptosyltransferase-1
MKVLLVKTSSLGDVVHTFPAVTDALAAIPGLQIDWLVESAFSDVARLHPGVQAVIEMSARRWRKTLFQARTWREIADVRRRLRANGYDRVVDAQGLIKSAVFSRLAGRPIHGFDRASVRESLATLAYSVRHPVSRDLHAIERTRRLVGDALGYAPTLDRLDYGIVAPEPPSWMTRRQGLALMLHGTTWASKRWPSHHWIALAAELSASGYAPAMTYGDDEERAIAEAVKTAVSQVELIPRLSMRDIASVIAQCRLVVGVDTGLLHLAAAFGVRTIGLFASTSPQLTGPVGRSVSVIEATTPCAPCRKRVCPLVPAGTEPPCHDTLAPARVLSTLPCRTREQGSRTDGATPPTSR